MSLLNPSAQPKPLQLEAGSSEQAAPFCLQTVHGARETVGSLKKTCEGVLLSGDHANFPNYTGFFDSVLARIPPAAVPGTVTGTVTQRVTRCFSQHSPDGET